MPAIGNIALADAEAAPVTHTFSPVTTDGSVAKFANRAASIPQGFETLQIEVVTPSNSTAAYRVKVKASFPTVAVVAGTDSVVKISSFEAVLNCSQLSTAQERKNYAKMIADLFTNGTFVSVVENVEPIY